MSDLVFSGGGGNYVLSTSFVGYTPVYGGVSPMCKDGYGCFYCVEQNKCVRDSINQWKLTDQILSLPFLLRINFWVSSWTQDVTTCSRMLFDAVCLSLDDLSTMLSEPAATHPVKMSSRM